MCLLTRALSKLDAFSTSPAGVLDMTLAAAVHEAGFEDSRSRYGGGTFLSYFVPGKAHQYQA